jgi:hypothetical protein
MKKRIKVLIFACFLVLTTVTVVFTVTLPINKIKSMWVWNFSTAVATPEARRNLIDFTKANKINLLYVNTGKVLPNHSEEFSALIEQAHLNGIQVFALDGDPFWALTVNHMVALNRIQEVFDFNTAHPDAKFDGIQHDVEPYALPEWRDHQAATAVQFLQLLEESQHKINDYDSSLHFDVSIPFGYEEAFPQVTATYNGVSKALSYHILDIVDSVTVMDYRNTAGNTDGNHDGQIDHGKQEVAYAAFVGKKAIIGAETIPPDGGGIPDFITYFHYGKVYMNTELQKVINYFANNPGFGGVAIHHYDTYVLMKNSPSK